MNLLLDSVTLLYAQSDPECLNARARKALLDPARTLAFSMVTVLELQLKCTAGKLSLLPDPRHFFKQARADLHLPPALPIREEDIHTAGDLPPHHSDPFDRLLIAQAMAGNFTLVTPNRIIPRYKVALLW